ANQVHLFLTALLEYHKTWLSMKYQLYWSAACSIQSSFEYLGAIEIGALQLLQQWQEGVLLEEAV
ncbi:hypothetical protein DF186_24815, partial [Enterococcus hirae]